MSPFEQGFEQTVDPSGSTFWAFRGRRGKKEALGVSASTLRNLPRVKARTQHKGVEGRAQVTGYDIAANVRCSELS